MRVGIIGWQRQETNPELVRAWREAGIDAVALTPPEALTELIAGDVAIGRIDVLPTLDGIEPSLEVLDVLAHGGVRVLNAAGSLIGTHDKLATADRLRRAHIRHPASVHVRYEHDPVCLSPPVVVKPRFRSWGNVAFLCRDAGELARCLRDGWARRWFRRHGALVQELVRPRLYDLRLIVAGGRVVGAARRDAVKGDWRTNVSLGGSLSPALPDRSARALALAAASAVQMDLVGVDLLPTSGEAFVVLELNGAVDFDERYSLPGGDVYRDAAAALGIDATSAGGDVRHLSA